MVESAVKQSYEVAKKRYAAIGVDTDAVLKKLQDVKISMHCWQGDDVHGFWNADGELPAYPTDRRKAEPTAKVLSESV